MSAALPAIAVIIAAYNAEATLDRAVASALAQAEVAEVCVVDDCSTDGTLARAQAWAAREPRVLVLAQSVNRGPSAARNAAIAATRAPWLAILDADDYLLPGRFAALLALSEGADFVADALIRVQDGATPRAPAPPSEWAALTFEAFVLGNLGARDGPLDLGFLKPLMRRDFIDAHALRYIEGMRLGEDYEFYAHALALGTRFRTCAPCGYVSVERAGSLSKAHNEADLQRLRDCDDALANVRPLSSTEQRALRRHRTSVDCRLQWRRLISAVKTGDIAAAAATFHTPSAAFFLSARLIEQAWLRTGAAMRRATAGD